MVDPELRRTAIASFQTAHVAVNAANEVQGEPDELGILLRSLIAVNQAAALLLMDVSERLEEME